jgi:hypothetical protein
VRPVTTPDLSVRRQVRDALKRRDYAGLIGLCRQDRRFWSALRLCLYENDADLRWPAIEAIARFMKRRWSEGDREKVREYLRGLLWRLNEESGNIGWGAPEVVAEIIVSVPELLEPYGGIMLAYSLESPVLIDGSLWAIGRLGKRINKEIALYRDKVFTVFGDDRPQTLGLAAWAMGEAGIRPALVHLAGLQDRAEPVRIYVDGRFHEKSLGAWAREAIAGIDRSQVAAAGPVIQSPHS